MIISKYMEGILERNGGFFGLIRSKRLAEELQTVVGSQIELHFVCTLVSWIEGTEATYAIVSAEEDAANARDFFIWPQRQIGKYRVDFVIGRAGKRPVIVECDGREFHHATRDQIERDRRRDEELASAGWRVLRYPGTQIHKDPLGVTAEVITAVDADHLRTWSSEHARFRK